MHIFRFFIKITICFIDCAVSQWYATGYEDPTAGADASFSVAATTSIGVDEVVITLSVTSDTSATFEITDQSTSGQFEIAAGAISLATDKTFTDAVVIKVT